MKIGLTLRGCELVSDQVHVGTMTSILSGPTQVGEGKPRMLLCFSGQGIFSDLCKSLVPTGDNLLSPGGSHNTG